MNDTLDYANLLVSSHAIERYRERSGDNKSNLATISKQIKALISKCPVIEGKNNFKYVRATSLGTEPIWFVIRGRAVKTVLTHSQYLRNVETGRAD